MAPEFTQVIRPLDIREAGEEKHISFLNGVFNTSEEKKEGDEVEEKERKTTRKSPSFFTSSNRFFLPLVVLLYIIMSVRKVGGSKATGLQV